jgi:serine/threonine-protein kinase
MEVTPSVRLLSPIGEGGMGAVWLADHTGLNTRVVVKFMLGGLDSSTTARTRFKREAEAASQVKSPHVVQTFDYGVTGEGVPFIVMEYLEGRDLRAEIAARGALDPATVVTIVTQVAKALTKAHAAGLLHRDIKPDNIFLCHGEAGDDLFVKLLDFGIAKTPAASGEAELDGETKTGQVVGTPFYMSPEQVTAQKVVDLRSDLWSLGVVAFEALTGRRPYDGPSFGALAVKIATGESPRPSHENPALPPSVDAWFARACAREPSARFSSARELSDHLRAAFEGVVSLPPVASGGALSDSGPRPPSSSFVLASTVSTDDPAGDPSALARSEPGRIVVAATERTESSRASGRPPARGKVIVPVIGLAVVTLALAAGWKAREHSETSPASSLAATPSASPLPSGEASAPVPVATVTPSAALPVAPSASASASALPRALPVPQPAVVRTSTPAASTKPGPSASAAPAPSARPTATVHDDPLF